MRIQRIMWNVRFEIWRSSIERWNGFLKCRINFKTVNAIYNFLEKKNEKKSHFCDNNRLFDLDFLPKLENYKGRILINYFNAFKIKLKLFIYQKIKNRLNVLNSNFTRYFEKKIKIIATRVIWKSITRFCWKRLHTYADQAIFT